MDDTDFNPLRGAQRRHRGEERIRQRHEEMEDRVNKNFDARVHLKEEIQKRKTRIKELGLVPGMTIRVRVDRVEKDAKVVGFDETSQRYYTDADVDNGKDTIFISDENGYVWVSYVDSSDLNDVNLCDPFDIKVRN